MRLTILLLAGCVAACGGKLRDQAAPTADGGVPAACERRLGPRVIDHACQHGRLGPFVEVRAVTDPELLPPSVSANHHAFNVGLLRDDTSTDGSWYVGYRPARPGQHAVLSGDLGNPVLVEMHADEGPLEPIHSQSLDTPDDCGGMTTIDVFDLQKGADYRIVVGPTESESVRLFFEHPPTFGREAWVSECSE